MRRENAGRGNGDGGINGATAAQGPGVSRGPDIDPTGPAHRRIHQQRAAGVAGITNIVAPV